MKALRDLLIILLITLGIAEVGARLYSKTSAVNGMPLFTRYALLPHRPDPAVMEKWAETAAKAEYSVQDDAIGWVPGKGVSKEVAPGVVYESNPQTVRAKKDHVFGPEAAPGKVRIVAVGDSFTHGDEVSNADTWEAKLDALRSDVEVLNLGVGGYGTDQALLRYRRDGAPFKPQIAVLGIWPENVVRNLSILRYYLDPAGGFLVKPRFLLEGGQLRLVGSPVPHDAKTLTQLHSTPETSELVTKYDFWYSEKLTQPKLWEHLRIANVIGTLLAYKEKKAARTRLLAGEDPTGIDLMVAIAKTFAAEAKAAGVEPVVLVLPMMESVLEPGFDPAKFPLTKALRAASLDVVDLTPAIMQATKDKGPQAVFLPSSHYSAAGNQAVAEALAKELDPFVKRGLAAREAAEAHPTDPGQAPAEGAAPAEGEQPKAP